MRRNTKDELLRGFLAINAMLREELRGLKGSLEKRSAETKYNPNWSKQPRAPRGVPTGGQWVDGGGRGGRSKQVRQPRPNTTPEPRPERPTPQRLPVATNDNMPTAANDNSLARLPLRAGPLAAITLPLSLYGDTPRPTSEARHITDDLVLVITQYQGNRGATFHRVITPERQVPITAFGVDTGLTTTQPAELEHLYVYATVEGDQVLFDRDNLGRAYGRPLPSLGSDETPPSRSPQIVPLTREERRLDFNLRHLGATSEEVAFALQALRNQESEGELFIAALRRSGTDRRTIENVRRELRLARRDQPYRPPTSGPLLEVFPELATARGDTMIFAADGWDNVAPNIRRSERAARASADVLINEILALDPDYIAPNLNDPSNFPRTAQGRVEYVEQLRRERAAALFRVRGDLQPLQVETYRFIQRRVDIAYDEAARLYDRGELSSPFQDREHAIGTRVDRDLDRDLRRFYAGLGISVEGELVRVHRGESITHRTYRIPDARVGYVYFDISVAEKRPSLDQIAAYFRTMSRPRYVLIVRPRQRGRSYIITPPRGRYARD